MSHDNTPDALGLSLRLLRVTHIEPAPAACHLPGCRGLADEVERLRALFAEIGRTAGRRAVAVTLVETDGRSGCPLRVIATADREAAEKDVARVACAWLDTHLRDAYERDRGEPEEPAP